MSLLPTAFTRLVTKMATSIPTLPDVEVLSPRVIRILGGNPGKFTLQGTNTYLLGTGSSRILLDTGEGLPSWSSSLTDLLASQSLHVSHCLLTHWHHDHVLGVPSLLALSPHTKVYKATLTASLPSWAAQRAAPDETGWEAIADGEEFAVEGATLTAVATPGHTSDHMAFTLAEEGDAVFAGDAVLGHGTAVFEDLPVYLASLEKLSRAAGKAARLYPGHGAVVDDARGKMAEYLSHRKRREEEVLGALRGVGGGGEGRGMTSMEVVKVVYRHVDEMLHVPAEGGIKQVLGKLKAEGKVTDENGSWRVVGKSAL